MAARISTRVATVDDDAERLQQIVATAFSSDKNWFNQADIAKDERISTEELRAIIKAGLDPVLVAEVDGVVAGCLLIQYCRNHPEMNLPEDATIFGMLAVHHEYGSMGLGGRLARTALALAVRNGCRKGLIFVLNKRKDLQENYQRKGFKWNGAKREFKVTAGEILQPDVWYMVYERDFTWLEVLLVKTGVLDYCIRAPHTATINQVKVDTQQMERGKSSSPTLGDLQVSPPDGVTSFPSLPLSQTFLHSTSQSSISLQSRTQVPPQSSIPAPRTSLQVSPSTRLATVDDAECLQKIVCAVYSSDKNRTNQSTIIIDERVTTEELRASIKAGVDPLVVAEVDGALAGCLQIQHSGDHPDLNLPQDAGMLAVHHEYGSMGIGGRLARTALALAVRQGCRKGLIVVLNKRKDLQRIYERNGFKWNGEKREFRVASGKVLQPDVWYLVYERDISLFEVSLIRLGVLDFWVF